MILWGRPSSVNVQKVLGALTELGLPYDHLCTENGSSMLTFRDGSHGNVFGNHSSRQMAGKAFSES